MTTWTEAQIDRHLHLWEHRHGPDSPEAGIVRQLRAERDRQYDQNADFIVRMAKLEAVTPKPLPNRVMVWHSNPALDHTGTWATTRYPDNAVVYVPEDVEMQPTVLDETSPRAAIGEIGNQIHNLACEFQHNEDLAEKLERLACELWRVARTLPTTQETPHD